MHHAVSFTFKHIWDAQSERFVYRSLRGFEGICERIGKIQETKKEEEIKMGTEIVYDDISDNQPVVNDFLW